MDDSGGCWGGNGGRDVFHADQPRCLPAPRWLAAVANHIPPLWPNLNHPPSPLPPSRPRSPLCCTCSSFNASLSSVLWFVPSLSSASLLTFLRVAQVASKAKAHPMPDYYFLIYCPLGLLSSSLHSLCLILPLHLHLSLLRRLNHGPIKTLLAPF